MSRKTRFWIWFLVIVLLYAVPLLSMIYLRDIFIFTIVSASFLSSVYLLYRFTIKKKEPKYPIVPPEGKPDIYMAARMPRPILKIWNSILGFSTRNARNEDLRQKRSRKNTRAKTANARSQKTQPLTSTLTQKDTLSADKRRLETTCQHGYAKNAELNTQVGAAKQNAQTAVHQKINT